MAYQWRVPIPSEVGSSQTTFLGDVHLSHIHAVHKHNSHNVSVLVCSWCSFLGDSPIDDGKPRAVVHRFRNRLVFTDVKAITSSYSELALKLQRSLHYAVDGQVLVTHTLYDEFKHTPVFREYAAFVSTKDPSVLKWLLTFLLFGKKSYMKDPGLNTTALRKWEGVEKRLSELVLPSWVSNLKPIVDLILDRWEFDEFLPKHGSGAVSEVGVKGVNLKSWFLQAGAPAPIAYLYGEGDRALKPVGSSSSSCTRRPLTSPIESSSEASRISRLKFVPKDYRNSRSICMEPVSVMWAQQAVRRVLERAISDGILRNHVVLEDQSHSRYAAMLGSLGVGYDTIDLSSASDSVSWDLLKKVFPSRVLKHLHATRTSLVSTRKGGKPVSVKKYAPMGSALCFPTQCIVYSSIVLYLGICEYYRLDWRRPGILTGRDIAHYYNNAHGMADARKMLPFRIYGDDIACDQRVTSNLVSALTEIGFEVNVEKSFTGSSCYRESCGGHYFRGHDVTPLPFKPKEVSERVSMKAVGGLITLANECQALGYMSLHRYLVGFIMHYPIDGVKQRQTRSGTRVNPILFTEDKDVPFAIFRVDPRNAHLQSAKATKRPPRLLQDLQYPDMVRSIALLPTDKVVVYLDDYRYSVWWRSRYTATGSPVSDGASGEADTLEVGARWRWTPIWK